MLGTEDSNESRYQLVLLETSREESFAPKLTNEYIAKSLIRLADAGHRRLRSD